jgi:hypothetical protein
MSTRLMVALAAWFLVWGVVMVWLVSNRCHHEVVAEQPHPWRWSVGDGKTACYFWHGHMSCVREEP